MKFGVRHVMAGGFMRDDAGALTIAPWADTAPLTHSIQSLLTRPNVLPMLLEVLSPGQAFNAARANAGQYREEFDAFWREYSAATRCQDFVMVPMKERELVHGFSMFLFEGEAPANATTLFQELCDVVAARMDAIQVDEPRANPLTPRQCDVLRLCADGKRDAEIAEVLGISTVTAHGHIEDAKRRLNARTRIQAVVIALRNNWI